MEARDLVPGSRVALLGPGSVAHDLIVSGGVRRLELADLVTRTA